MWLFDLLFMLAGMNRWRAAAAVLVIAILATVSRAGDFKPDPASVQREGKAYRYPQAGWIVVHVEGEPYERGVQQGKLLWREIQAYINCFALQESGKSPSDGWAALRTMSDALFVRRFDPELLEEMKGIADGAAAGGAKFDGRPVDLKDIVTINVWPEMMSLDDALRAQATGLEGKDFDAKAGTVVTPPKEGRCSAFAATGIATKDGKAIIGHITMFDEYPCNFFNVWIDVKPAKGHRVVFQGAPGSVQSGMDWYINDAGLVLTETTIWQTRFEPNGMSIGSRSRMAMQYGDSIDSAVKILGENGNGLYTNEWLLANMKSNEIALYELGTKTSRLMRSSKNEWFGGTEGFYWGNNNTKDMGMRLETIPATNDRPADMTFVPEPRDREWVKLYQQYKGKIDENFAKTAFGRPPLVSRHSCDAKFVTADLALQLKSDAFWGNPYGQLWEPTADEREKYPEAAPIVPNEWTVLTGAAPLGAEGIAKAVDLNPSGSDQDDQPPEMTQPAPAWHGTILAESDGDVWLTSAFARFQEYVARENQMVKDHEKDADKDMATTKPSDSFGELTQDERDERAVRMFGFRSEAMSAGMDYQSVPLRKMKASVSDDAWFRSASGRGVMLLAELRRRMGAEKFDAAMDAFGRENAGKRVDSDSFVAAMSAASSIDLKDFFAHWLDATDALPTLELSAVSSEKKGDGYSVSGTVVSHGPIAPASIDVTLETEDDETTKTISFDSGTAKFEISSDKKPTRVVVNKYGLTPIANGWNWPGSEFKRDLRNTLIIYGTRYEAVGNAIAAEKLQKAIIGQWEHQIVEIKADTSVTDDDLRGHHILLVGRPECSALIERLAATLPVTFGNESFVVRGETYANADSAVIAAAANPLDGHFSMVCVAGLSTGATLRAAKMLPEFAPAPVKVMAAHGKSVDIVAPAAELVRDLK